MSHQRKAARCGSEWGILIGLQSIATWRPAIWRPGIWRPGIWRPGIWALLLAVTLVGPDVSAALIHQYELNGSYSDQILTGPDLKPQGGHFNPENTEYIVDVINRGLLLEDDGGKFVLPLNDGNYSILMDFKFDSLSNLYQKIIDFKNRTVDSGLYVTRANGIIGEPYFVGATGDPATGEKNPAGASAMTAGVYVRLIITRDISDNNHFDAYFNGKKFVNFFDPGGLAVFSEPNGPMHFLRDDLNFGATEAATGAIDRIWIYDAPLSDDEVASLETLLGPAGSGSMAGVVPEPSSLLMSLSGAGILLFFRRRIAARAKQ